MLINLNKIFNREETEKQLNFELDFSKECVSTDAVFDKPVQVQLNLKKQTAQTLIYLTVCGEATCSCGRCLKLFSREFNFSQEFSVTPTTLTMVDKEIPVSSDSTLDVKQLVLQELSLELPTTFVCSEDCQGLCSICGKPKEENCKCQLNQIDPRLMVLKQLLENDDN